MIKDIVLQHKIEKERLLSKDYVSREKLDFGRRFVKSDLIKIITGPRRAGKSVFLYYFYKILIMPISILMMKTLPR